MGRKSTVQLLQEALAAGDIEKAKELSKKLKPEKESKLIVQTTPELVESFSSSPEEKSIDKPKRSKHNVARRIPAPSETPHIAPSKGVRKIVPGGSGEKLMTVVPFTPKKMDGWVDNGREARGDSIKVNPDYGAQRITERRSPVSWVEIQCSVCMNWFEIPESKALLSGEHYRCSKCCTRG